MRQCFIRSLGIFSSIFTRGDNFCEFLFASLNDDAFPKLSTFKEKKIGSR